MGAEVIVVVGANGGVGASTLAALLARSRGRVRAPTGDGAAATRRVALVDLDHGGAGIEVLLGVEERPGARWADLRHVRGAVDQDDLVDVLPRWEGVEVLGGDRRSEPVPDALAVGAVWEALVEGCATVVVDVPGRALVAGVPGLEVVLGGRHDLLLVCSQDVVGVAGALTVRGALPPGPARLVLRRRRRARVAPLEAAQVLDLPLATMLPRHGPLAASTERGLGPVVGRWSAMRAAVDRLAQSVGVAEPSRPRTVLTGGRTDD